MRHALQRIEWRVTEWLAERGIEILRVGLGIVFLWFGALKLVPGMSPAEALVIRTVEWILDPAWFLPVLGLWECAVGIGLILNRFPRLTLLLFFAHMPGTFMPLAACPELVWTSFPFGWTLEGQYILKNVVLIGAATTLSGRLAIERRRAARATLEATWNQTVPLMRISQRSRRRVKSTMCAMRVSVSSSRSTADASCG